MAEARSQAPATGGGAAEAVALPPIAVIPVGAVLALDAALLGSTITRYGYHRDELYFRLLSHHPAWGYVDQPPLTPMLARAGIAVFGDSVWALRIPALLCALVAVAVTAALARELGGGAGAQAIAALGVSGPFLLVVGHVLLTAGPDLVVWLLVILFATRALLRDRPRWWLGAGLTVGIGLYDKPLVVLLLAGLLAGLLAAGPRRALVDGRLWAGALLAVLVGLPNLLYQATNGWPQVTMARAIAAHKGHDDRILLLPFQLLLIGLPVTQIWLAGLGRLLRDPGWRAVRALGWAYPVVLVIVLVTGGQTYYPFALLAFLYAAGCVGVAQRLSERRNGEHRARRRWRGTRRHPALGLASTLVLNLVIGVVVALPVFPVRALPAAVAAVNQTARDSVGWPEYVRQVAAVYAALPAADRGRAVLIAGNYGEAGALDRYGPGYHLPAVFSGQNELYRFGPPPAGASVVVAVGLGNLSGQFGSCLPAAVLDNGVGVDNEEQGRSVQVCRDPRAPWPQLWPQFQHYD